MRPEISLIFLCLSLLAAEAAAQGGRSGGGPRKLWCVAKNNADDAALQSALDWACGPGGADCSRIQKGGPCYDASDLLRTASFAFNDYFVKHGGSEDSCRFSNTADVTSLNPSHSNCKFPSSENDDADNVKSSGSAIAGSETADISSGNSVAGRLLDRRWMFFYLFFSIIMTQNFSVYY